MIRIEGLTTDDVAEIVEALITAAADAEDNGHPDLALRWTWLANDLGDALDQLPAPPDPDPPD